MIKHNTSPLDLVWGASKIAEVIGTSARRAFDLLEKGRIPGRKVGGRWVVDRQALDQFFHIGLEGPDTGASGGPEQLDKAGHRLFTDDFAQPSAALTVKK